MFIGNICAKGSESVGDRNKILHTLILRQFCFPCADLAHCSVATMSSFCDNKRQYSAFFGAQEAVDEQETTFNHVDWPTVPGGEFFLLPFASIPLKSDNSAGNAPYTTSTLEYLISNQEPQIRVMYYAIFLSRFHPLSLPFSGYLNASASVHSH